MSDNVPPIRASLEELIALRNHINYKFLINNRVSTLRLGGHLSTFRGRGMEFEEVRGYQAGDDIRNMDWRVTARTGQAHTKIFREERERPTFFIVDQSQSMCFGTRVMFKSVMAARISSLLAWSFLDMGDRIGSTVFNDTHFWESKARRGKQGVLSLLNILSKPSDLGSHPVPKDENSINIVLKRLIKIVRPGSLIFIIGDFYQLGKQEEKYLSILSKHCELVAINVYDAIEKKAPPGGLYSISDGQSFMTLNTYDDAFVQSYESIYNDKHENLQSLSRKYNIHLFSIATHHDSNKILRGTLAPLCSAMGIRR